MDGVETLHLLSYNGPAGQGLDSGEEKATGGVWPGTAAPGVVGEEEWKESVSLWDMTLTCPWDIMMGA